MIGRIKVSRSLKELGAKIDVIKKEAAKKGKDITIEEMAKTLSISKEEIILALEANSSNVVSSIDEPVYDNGEGKTYISDTLQSEKNEELEITNKLSIKKLIEELEERDKKIIILRYFKGKTQTEVSKLLGVSQVQISRIEKKILTEMRRKISM